MSKPLFIHQFQNIYPLSIHSINNITVCVLKSDRHDVLLIEGDNDLGFKGVLKQVSGFSYIEAPLSHANANTLRSHFPFTKPIPVLRKQRSFGLGDRLGIAGEGHLEVFRNVDAFPVLAQQSMRELTLTERTYEDVLDAASFAAFKFGYHDGFGADGDHLKKMEDIERVLNIGYTMITLDCSDYIKNDVMQMTDSEIEAKVKLPKELIDRYLSKPFEIEGATLRFSAMDLKRAYYVYSDAISYTKKVYETFFKNHQYNANLELSIDETMTPTKPEEHFYVANELKLAGVVLDTLAPRFCGEFQKGVDYIGDIKQFERELKIHAAIANHFDYKLSIHSGSDKFSIFTLIGKHTKGRFHIKTAGTNWLEAVRLVAIQNPALYREVHAYALESFAEAKKLYHVTTDLAKIPWLSTLKDEDLPKLFEQNDARQLIHITYGAILTAKNSDGSLRFKTRLYDLWRHHSQSYKNMLQQHIGRHVDMLYKGFKS